MEESSGSSREPPLRSSPPHIRTRARSNSIRGGNPLETPLTTEEHDLARLGTTINRSQAAFRRTVNTVVTTASREDELQRAQRAQRRAQLLESGGYSGTIYAGRPSDSPNLTTQSGFLAPRADPVDRSRTPTQEQVFSRQSRPAAHLLPGNTTFGEPSSSELQYPLPDGPRPLPISAGRQRTLSHSTGSQLQPRIPQRVLGPKPPIPVVERPANLPARPAPHWLSPQTGESSRSAQPNRLGHSQDFPVRQISNTKTNPARRTAQISTPVGLHPGNTARVDIWDPRFRQDSSTSSEAFPTFKEYYPPPSSPSRSSASNFTSDSISEIGRLIARDRRPRSGSNSSFGSVVTAIHVGRAPSPQLPNTAEADSSTRGEEKDEDLDLLRNPRVFSVQLPESYFHPLEESGARGFTSTSSPSSQPQEYTAHSPEQSPDILGDSLSSVLQDKLSSAREQLVQFSSENSRLDLLATQLASFKNSKASASRLLSDFHNSELPDCKQSEQSPDPHLENKYYNKGLESSQSLLHIKPSGIENQRKRAASQEPVDTEHGNSSTLLKPIPKRSFSLSDRPPSYNMSFQNYADQPSGGIGVNPRQAPPSPSQGAPHTNGMNGGIVGGMVGYPTPAGHQSDLNYLMTLVEDLSGVLAHNQRLTNGVVEKMGRVREKAKNFDLSNDELLQLAASELNDTSHNLERENTELRAALEKSDYDKKENFKLACHGANILADITEKMHAFKEQHEADTLAWHKNYRKQLAEEREENLRLRNEINDKIAAAVRANGHLRDMRRHIADHDELNELKIQNIQLRQERRWWKRMALPLIPQDDPEWSDDDDLIDPEEKKRVAAAQVEKQAKDMEDAEGGRDASGA